MINTFETGLNVQKWTGSEHFKNPLTTMRERKPFAARVTDYIDLLREAFPVANEWGDNIIPLQGTDVSGADFPLLTQFMSDIQLEIQTADPQAKFSLAVTGSKEVDRYLLGIGAMKDGTYYGGLSFAPQPGGIGFSLISVGGSSPAFNRAFDRLTTEFKGFTASQQKLQAADKLFKFIVSQTLDQVHEKFT